MSSTMKYTPAVQDFMFRYENNTGSGGGGGGGGGTSGTNQGQRSGANTSTFMNMRRRQLSSNTRIRQILLQNQSSLNNVISDLKEETTNITKKPQNTSNLKTNISNNSLDISSNNNSVSGLIKKPFKHYINDNKNTRSLNNSPTKPTSPDPNRNEQNNQQNTPKNMPNPSTELLLKTANDVNNFVEHFEKMRIQNQIMFAEPHYYARKPYRPSVYSGLKPLNYVIQNGPNIKNCLGIIKEPSGKVNNQIREIYEYKLKLLEEKNRNEALKLKNSQLYETISLKQSLNSPLHERQIEFD